MRRVIGLVRCSGKTWAATAGLLGIAALASGCSLSVLGSSPALEPISEVDDLVPVCQSTLGSYTLPKHVLRFIITKKSGDKFHVLRQIEPKAVPDNRHVFCLDHLRSAFADDQVRVFKNKAEVKPAANPPGNAQANSTDVTTPFLQLIASKAIDRTASIVRRFVRAAFILLSNKGDFKPANRSDVNVVTDTFGAGNVVVADFQVDPFDFQEMARVNEAARPLGFCFVLEDYTFNRSFVRGNSANAYCSDPLKVAYQHPPKTAKVISEMRYLLRKPVSGIFFRPRASYRLTVYVKPDPNGSGQWRPGLIKNYLFENIMPIVSVGVDRAVFATRRTGLVFDDGMLTNICIAKGSEVLGGLAIPLEVIYGIIALPTAVLQAGVASDSLQRQVVEQRGRLVAAQKAYIEFLSRRDANLSGVPSPKANPIPPLSLGTDPAAPKADAFGLESGEEQDPGAIASDDVLKDICAELVALEARAATATTQVERF